MKYTMADLVKITHIKYTDFVIKENNKIICEVIETLTKDGYVAFFHDLDLNSLFCSLHKDDSREMSLEECIDRINVFLEKYNLIKVFI